MRLGRVAVVLFALPFVALAVAQRVGDASVVFDGKGPGGFKLEGRSQDLSVRDNGQVLQIIVPLASLHTGIALRDRHMREKYLETDKYPDAVLDVPWSAVTLPADGQSSSGRGRGVMHLHGQSKDVEFAYTVSRRGNVYQVVGKTPILMTDFGIKTPGYLGLTVQPDIATTVQFSATKP